MEKFPIEESKGSDIVEGRLVGVYEVDGAVGGGSGTEYATAGQYGSECTNEQAKDAVQTESAR